VTLAVPVNVTNGERDVDKCIGCQHYDRQLAKAADAKGVQWGQCRRSAPMLHPVNAKSYMIEGVWPHVRDDDWCGEWKAAVRRVEPRIVDPASGPLVPGLNTPLQPASRPAASFASRPAGSASFNVLPPKNVAASGGGD
jgi:hypothetical protein